MSQTKRMNGRFLSVTLPGIVMVVMVTFFLLSNQNGYWTSVLYSTGTLSAPPFKQTPRKQLKSDNIPFLIQQREIQESRRRHLKSACLKYNIPQSDVISNPPWNLYLDTNHKLLYCNIPKVACTSWKRVILVLTGVMKHTDDMEQRVVNRYGRSQLTSLSKIPFKDRQEVLDTYTKFMFARHPFSRVLSAFNNKINPNTTDSKTVWTQRQQLIASIEGEEQGPTFIKFLRYILGMTPDEDDRHWSTATNMCLPCDIDYDVIGKFETLSDDANYILKLANVDHLVEFPSAKGSSPTNSSKKDTLQMQFDGIPLNIVHNLYEKYILDFRLFNYSIPKLNFF
ncbi:carbohydrate sulfotransferase 11-like [Anneissia japonica]|uniref:carbohydrate sulfotransferase 11-like n=1 Tax=Anneissia japonica TaxID=1529436 RepID=UPI0014255A25|nr:carbohydrate sulfotransferase 11-like [Anneissia japonica]XP_033098685.1 carbohydrate sulfotransferase 11-like [Anneissia japonica]